MRKADLQLDSKKKTTIAKGVLLSETKLHKLNPKPSCSSPTVSVPVLHLVDQVIPVVHLLCTVVVRLLCSVV
jgi:hypothetical protein